MTSLLNTHKVLNHLQKRIELISNLAEADEHFEEVEKELREIRELILVGKFDVGLWE
jgi:hypothetical protein